MKYKFGFDLDETITAAPEHMTAIMNALYDAGHEVHIITYRHPLHHLEQTKKELKSYGIKYHQLHMTGQKDQLCDMWGIDMALDDSAEFHYKDRAKFWIGFVLPKIKLKLDGYGQNFPNKKPKTYYACDVATHTEAGEVEKLRCKHSFTDEEYEELKKHDLDLQEE